MYAHKQTYMHTYAYICIHIHTYTQTLGGGEIITCDIQEAAFVSTRAMIMRTLVDPGFMVGLYMCVCVCVCLYAHT